MNRGWAWTVAFLLLVGLCWRFPLFHVISLERATQEKAAGVFSPTTFAEQFWNEQLLKSLNKAAKAEELLAAIHADAGTAKKTYSRSVGVSESYTYFIGGAGSVLAVSEDEISLAVTEGATNAEVSLQTGLLFSNAVRDGTGLLSVNDYPDSQDFNAISEALNRIIEERVLPKLRETASVGAIISFVGCAEVNDESTDLKPLKIVPIQTEIR